MKNIIELNKEIEAIFNPEIYIFNEYRNITFRNHWVNEIYDKENYFLDWEKEILNKIDNTIDLGNPLKIKFIKILHQDVLGKYSELSKINYEDLDYLKSFRQFPILFSTKLNRSKVECSEFYSLHENKKYGEFLNKMARIFKIEDYEFYDAEYDPESYKDVLQDEIMFKLHDIEELVYDKKDEDEILFDKKDEDKDEIDILMEMGEEIHKEMFGEEAGIEVPEREETIFKLKNKEEEEEINRYYSYGFLSYCLENTRTLLKNIVKHLDNLVNLIRKLENFEDDKLTLDEILINDPTDIKLEYKLSKMEVALFYRALHDTGIIHVNNQGQKHPYTNLKSYIDNSNIYYLDKAKMSKVNDITRQFARFLNDNKYEKHELKMLNHIIEKFKSRIEYIKANQEEGLA